MTVKELKEKLATMEDSLEVYLYSDPEEAGCSAYNVSARDNGKASFPYCGGDKPEGLAQKYALISG